MSNAPRPTVAFLIPNHNGADLLPKCLQSLRKQQEINPIPVLVDTASDDQSVRMVETEFPEALIIRGLGNWGFTHCINSGIKATNSDWVVLFNNDAWLGDNWGSTFAEAIRTFSEIRVFAAQGISGRDKSKFYSLGEIFDHAEAHRVGYLRDRSSVKLTDLPDWVAGPSGYCGIYHRSVFQKIGLLAESFGSYCEDVDFNLRCVRAGFACRLLKDLEVYHLGGVTGGRQERRWGRQSGRNSMWFLRRHFRPWKDARILKNIVWRDVRSHLRQSIAGSAWNQARLLGVIEGLVTPKPLEYLDRLPRDTGWLDRLDSIWLDWEPFMVDVWGLSKHHRHTSLRPRTALKPKEKIPLESPDENHST